MGLVNIPNFAAKPGPDLADVRAAERSIVSQIGGVLEGVGHVGALNAQNIAAAPAFSLEQQLEGRHRVVLAPGRFYEIVPFAWVPAQTGPKAIIATDLAVDLDTATFWHSNAVAIKGHIDVARNGVLVTELDLPEGGVAQGEVVEFALNLSLQRGDVLDFRWTHAGVASVQDVNDAAVGQYMRIYVDVWGVASHVA